MPSLQSRVDDELAVLSRAGDRLVVTDGSAIRVYWFFAQFFKPGQWLIVRPGTAAVMLTTDTGLHALKMFRRGATLGDAKRRIGASARHDPDRVNLAPLVMAAARAGIVKSVDGIGAQAPATSPRRLLLHLLKIFVYPQLYALIDLLPMAARERLLFRLEWFFEGRFSCEMEKGRTLENLRLLFPRKDPGILEARAVDFYHQRTRNNLAFVTTGKGLKPVFRWLDVFLEDDPPLEERLRECLRLGQGLVVVSFHFGCYWMLPALLLKMGLRVHVLIGSVSDRERLIERAKVPGHDGARLKFYGPGLRAFLDLVRALGDGDVVLLFADTHGLGQQAVQRFVHETWGRSALAKTDATLLGHPFPVEAAVGWLHRNARAPIVPAVLHPIAGSWRVRLACGEPVGMSVARDRSERPLTDEVITAGVYGQLERWLTDMPEQWTYLNSFPTSRRQPAAGA
jgi:lauroyl/myristoyl acyltransferase